MRVLGKFLTSQTLALLAPLISGSCVQSLCGQMLLMQHAWLALLCGAQSGIQTVSRSASKNKQLELFALLLPCAQKMPSGAGNPED